MLIHLLAAAPVAAPAPPIPALPAVCPRFGAKPAGCVEPPLRDTVEVWGAWEPADATDPALVRAPRMVPPPRDALPLDGFPAALRGGPEGGTAEVTLRLTIGADGALTGCRAIRSEAWLVNPGKRIDLPADPALGPLACDLVAKYRRFRPAINRAGTRIAAPAESVVRFVRQRGEASIAPAPPPPSRWLGPRAGLGAVMWPPAHWIGDPVRIAEPRFSTFLDGERNLPRRATVGAALTFAPDGAVTDCQVKAPSGDPRLDAATCAALRTTRNAAPTRFRVWSYPVEVTWRGGKAEWLLPKPAVLPVLLAPIPIPREPSPANLAAQPPMRVTIQLDPQGRATSCRAWGTASDDAADAAACALALAYGGYKPGRDVFGRPASGGMSLRVDWAAGAVSLPPY